MVDMSDILKRIKEKRKEKKEVPGVQSKMPAQPPKEEVPFRPKEDVSFKPKEDISYKLGAEEAKEEKPQEQERPEKPELRITPAIRDLEAKTGKEESAGIYQTVVSLIENVMEKKTPLQGIDVKSVMYYVKVFVDQLSRGNDALLELAISLSTDKNYLAAHSVNVCILCIKLGLCLGYDRQKLEDLGISALLHDIGMRGYKKIISRAKKLSHKDYNRMKKHPIIGSEILQKLDGICKETIEAVRQEHERINGSGYPKGLRGEDISEFAKIIAVSDVYEAMTHSRPYRGSYVPFEAIKTIADTKDFFEKKLVKILINTIGLYPIGSYVQLSTGEKARITKINQGMPLRPVVEVLYDSHGDELGQGRQLNLLQHPTIYIRKPFGENPEEES